MLPSRRPGLLAAAALAGLALAGCQRDPLLVNRAVCPAVAVPYYAGDATLFAAGDTARDAGAVDLVATMTEVRGVCADVGPTLETDVSFKVVVRRTATAGARRVVLPFFASVVQGGNLLVSKQLGQVTLDFADGQARAQGAGAAKARVSRAATRLPDDIQSRISRKRKPGDLDAATDPLAEPEIRAAVRSASFEVLVGFQLDDAALAYNVTK